MSVCACPQGIIRRDCEYHQGVAQRFLETLNTTTRPAAHVTRTFSRGGYVHQETP